MVDRILRVNHLSAVTSVWAFRRWTFFHSIFRWWT